MNQLNCQAVTLRATIPLESPHGAPARGVPPSEWPPDEISGNEISDHLRLLFRRCPKLLPLHRSRCLPRSCTGCPCWRFCSVKDCGFKRFKIHQLLLAYDRAWYKNTYIAHIYHIYFCVCVLYMNIVYTHIYIYTFIYVYIYTVYVCMYMSYRGNVQFWSIRPGKTWTVSREIVDENDS